MTPHHLHALAAAWSLHTARQHLAQHARDEAAQIAAERREAPALLRSPVWGGVLARCGHGDPTPWMVATADRPARRNRWAEMDQRLAGKLDWLAGQLDHRSPDAAFGMDPIARVLAVLPKVQPGTARVTALHLQAEDRWIREAIGVGPERAPILGVDCPVCAHRTLYVQTAGPVDAWTVVCLAADCHLCTGQGCRCGMPGAVEGVAHIWPRAAVIAGAVAGATPTTTEGETR